MIKAANLDNIRAAVKRLGIVIIVFIAVCAFFGVLLPTFFTMANIQNILLTVSITGTLALGMTFAVISGGYDLSMGCGLTLSGVISGYLMTILGAPDAAAILTSLVFGLVLGFANGFMITKMKLPPFIATLGSMMLCKGLSLIISEGKVYAVGASEHPVYTGLVKGSVIGNIPNAIVLFVIFAVISHLILTRTVFGKYVFAIGSNEEAVKLSGIDADKSYLCPARPWFRIRDGRHSRHGSGRNSSLRRRGEHIGNCAGRADSDHTFKRHAPYGD